MPPVMNRGVVQTPNAERPKPALMDSSFRSAPVLTAGRPLDAGGKKSANAPVGSIAAIESQLGF